jgi:3-oxoacyl-(acyl-carrier-protein) synthase
MQNSQSPSDSVSNTRELCVQVSGMGVVSPAGLGVSSFWEAACQERSFLHNGLGALSTSTLQELDFFLGENFGEHETQIPAHYSRAVKMATAALHEALAEARWDSAGGEHRDPKLARPDTGLIFATTTGQIDLWEKVLPYHDQQKFSPREVARALHYQGLSTAVEDLQNIFRLIGPAFLIAPACAASTQALGLGLQWIRSGRVRRCIVGGTEILCDLTVEGFRALRLLSDQPPTPFDRNRTGINLCEAAVFFCLERIDDACEASDSTITGKGYGSDAFHATAPHPEGRGLVQSMHMALADSGLQASDIDWIHAHGTGSISNDLAEGQALRAVFGAQIAPVTSTKGFHGHALGVSGILESVLIQRCMREGLILGTTGCAAPDPRIEIPVQRNPSRTPLRHVMKNTLGFGGANGTLIFSRATRAETATEVSQ